MKTLNEILNQKPVFLHNWAEKIDVISDFEDISLTSKEYNAQVAPYPNVQLWLEKKEQMHQAIKQWEGINVLFASYGSDNYSGDAFVLFEREGNLFEVNGGHCSCYGLEGQFEPEPTTIDSIAHRLTIGRMGIDSNSDNEFANELKLFIGLS